MGRETNYHEKLSINPNALGAPKMPYVLRPYDVPPRMVEMYPDEQEIIYVTSSFSWYNNKTKVAWGKRVGETITEDELNTIVNYQDTEIKKGYGENFRNAHTSRARGVANHWKTLTLLASLRKGDSFRDNLHNERVMIEVIDITKELLTHYLKFFAWWVDGSNFAQELARMIADIKAGRFIVPQPNETPWTLLTLSS